MYYNFSVILEGGVISGEASEGMRPGCRPWERINTVFAVI